MMASNKVKLRHNSKKSRGARRALRLLARPDILLSAILVGNNFANILASSVVTIIFIDYFGGNVLVGSVILTIVILIFSEITPKTIANVYPEKFAEKSSWILKGLIFLFKPIIALTNFISSRLLKLLNVTSIIDLNENINERTENYFPWQDVMKCPIARFNESIIIVDFRSPPETWQNMVGRAGELTI